MKVVMTHGTFDLLHYAHIMYLEKAKAYGDYLIVLVTSDALAHSRGKNPYYDENTRMYMVNSLKSVDKVLLIDKNIEEDVLKENDVDIFISTNDGLNIFDQFKKVCEVHYLDRIEAISTTKIKDDLKMEGKK